MNTIGMDFNRLPITLHPWTITSVNGTVTLQNLGGRACIGIAGAGAATDGNNYCQAAASHRFVAGKQTRFAFSVRNADATNHAWVCGFNILSTTITANMESGGTPSTDFLLIHKLSGSLIPRLRTRKASGTAETVALGLTHANDTWVDYDVVVQPDASVSGTALVKVYASVALAAPTLVLATATSMCPDSVSTGLVFGCLEGDTGTDSTYFGHCWAEQEL